ncbi:flavodoxin domain-containing protein [Nocardioides sp. YIM 152588]|uniref:flavodoxin family protein n=1 Tax=Nocardioides sp. YIM 152588 TaxID=3158259 RepID=UPI0032E3B4BB
MHAVVVYESMFGNTEQIASGIAAGLEAAGATTATVDVGRLEPDDLAGCGLLVVGAPTHAFSLSRASTREDAVRQGADPARAVTGVREWLTTVDAAFPRLEDRPRVAVFDTRAQKVRRLPGSAGRAARVLRACGFTVVDRATFLVLDVKGPLAAGELDRAREWGAALGTGAGAVGDRDRHDHRG